MPLVVAVALLYGCAHGARNGSPATARGTRARIVTLVPSFADDVVAIGATARLVGVSAFTDAPGTQALPRVADATGVDTEAIMLLRPALVLGIPAQARFLQALSRAGIRVVLLPDDTYDQIFGDLRRIGALVGRERQADATIERLQRRGEAVRARAAGFRYHPSVFVVLGVAPIWTAGAQSYISTLIAVAGGRNAAADLHAAYGQYSAEALLRAQPDILIEDPATDLAAVEAREPWRTLRAVQRHDVYALDPDSIERPGPNYPKGLEWLFARIAPLSRSRPR
ncbi:MAG: ABC transporter substrate-binding protein [Candidatus Eremiobacteraeota bacterium]|nr:ABC transporter substrate-binding protein [Candidatus Eremiobacteraeota bacterium]